MGLGRDRDLGESQLGGLMPVCEFEEGTEVLSQTSSLRPQSWEAGRLRPTWTPSGARMRVSVPAVFLLLLLLALSGVPPLTARAPAGLDEEARLPLDALLDAALAHAEVPQCGDGEAPGPLGALPVAERQACRGSVGVGAGQRGAGLAQTSRLARKARERWAERERVGD